jgi:hypothetical protein
MDDHYPTIDEPATLDYVLSVLHDEHRQQCRYDSAADPDVSLSLETTVTEWREACDLIPTHELGRALNQTWGIACSDAEWWAVFEPADRRRIADVCELIARHAIRRLVRPARLLGSDCASAGAFLTIRSLLRQDGADVSRSRRRLDWKSIRDGIPTCSLMTFLASPRAACHLSKFVAA